MRGVNIPYLHVSFAGEGLRNFFFSDTKLFPSFGTTSTQNTFIWSVSYLCNVEWKNLNLKASNDASERGVVFISRDHNAVKSGDQPCVDVFRDAQKVVLPLELKHLKNMWEREREREREKEGEIFHNKASSIGNRPDIEFPVKVGLHLFIIKNIWNNRVSLLDMMNCKGRGLKEKGGNVYK